jgi:desampylase
MAVTISRGVHDALVATADETPSIEVCGLLFGTPRQIDDFAVAANVANDPARHFEIDPVVLIAAFRAARNGGPQIVGYFHSHPNGIAEPSATDHAMAAPDGAIWLIVAKGRLGVAIAKADGLISVPLCIID